MLSSSKDTRKKIKQYKKIEGGGGKCHYFRKEISPLSEKKKVIF